MGYFKTSIRGVGWIGGFRVFSRVIAFGRIAILARLLTPEQFGLFGIAALVLAFLEKFTATGIEVFLIQSKDKIEKYINDAWIISILRGVLISTIIFSISEYISNFFGAEQSLSIIRLIALVALIRGFINPARVVYLKKLHFRNEFLLQLLLLLIDTTVTLIIVVLYRTPAGIVWGLIASAIIEVTLTMLVMKPRPRPSFNKTKSFEIIRKGSWITASRILGYIFKQGDDIVVGRLLTTDSLGIYQVAYKISTLPLTEITQVVNTVTLPIYTKIGDDKERLKRAFLKTVLVVSILVFPIGFMIYVVPDIFVKVLLGNQWLGAVAVLKILAFFGIFQAISGTFNALYLSTNNQKYATYTNLLTLGIMAVTIVPFVKSYGVMGAGYSVTLAIVLSLPASIYFSRKVFVK